MPRTSKGEELEAQDQERLHHATETLNKNDKSKTLNWVYTNMAKIRSDLRILTACWGIMLIVGFIVKTIIATTNSDISKAQHFGYIFFTVATVGMIAVSWLFTKIMKKHVKEKTDEMMSSSEGNDNMQWGIQAMSNGFNQVVS